MVNGNAGVSDSVEGEKRCEIVRTPLRYGRLDLDSVRSFEPRFGKVSRDAGVADGVKVKHNRFIGRTPTRQGRLAPNSARLVGPRSVRSVGPHFGNGALLFDPLSRFFNPRPLILPKQNIVFVWMLSHFHKDAPSTPKTQTLTLTLKKTLTLTLPPTRVD